MMVPSAYTEEYWNADVHPVLSTEFPRRIKTEFLQAENMFIRSSVFLIFKCNIYLFIVIPINKSQVVQHLINEYSVMKIFVIA
jgi:hypothetical protein